MRFFNTGSGQVEEFSPYDPKRVTIYVCGPTVYDRIHLGNARALVVFDLLVRLLRRKFGFEQVVYIRNITDIDDKIIARAEVESRDTKTLTEEMTTLFHEDAQALFCLAPDREPKATEHIPQMIALIEQLLVKDCAYATSDGHVLFRARRFPEYGRFARLSPQDLLDGLRAEPLACREEKGDFVLWKPKGDSPFAPRWDSPWGKGRPGWHLECSAMCRCYLGGAVDIHGGGQDLIFPHHQNEIAQSRAAYPDEPFVKLWMHNGYVTCEGKKMSKSLGNFHRVCDLLQKFRGAALRLTLLRTHYRHPFDFSEEHVRESEQNLRDLYVSDTDESSADEFAMKSMAHFRPERSVDNERIFRMETFVDILEDDLNTPRALAYLFSCTKQIPYLRGRERIQAMRGLREALLLLGIENQATFTNAADMQWIKEQIASRAAARHARDFARADAIRNDLAQRGIMLEDSAEQTYWHKE